MEFFVFKDLLVIFILSIIVLLIGHRLHIPPVVGFLLTGVLSGPHGLGLVGETHDVEMLAQIGIILLLFGIGMEFSIKKLFQIKRLFLLGGTLQVGLTVLLGWLIGYLLGRPWQESIFLGCLLSMSSTAIVLGFLEQKGETSSPHGRVSISILIFQDMIAIPIILLIPLLQVGQTDEFTSINPSILWSLVKGIIILIGVFFCAERIVPRLLLLVARTRNKELFLLSVFSLCFGVAWLTSSLGLSLTIGAFLAGLIVSESEYSNEAIGNIFLFQALFISFFFISVGMLLDMEFVFQKPFTILALALGILLLKMLTGGLSTLILGMPIRTAVLVGIVLSQIGEFSFVLAEAGIPFGLVSDEHYQLFLAVSLLTMALNPIFMNFSIQIANLFAMLPLPQRLKTGFLFFLQESNLENHTIIIGFGVSGKNLALSSKAANIPYVILEMNPDIIKESKRKGEPIHFGDAAHPFILEQVNIKKAKAIAVLINDPIGARRIVKIAREANPSVYIIVRTRYVQDIPLMVKLGADEIIPDEFGTSVEIFSRVLKQYHVPNDEIERFIGEIRADGYELLRNQNKKPTKLSEIKMNLSHVEVSSFRVHSTSSLIGKSLAESQLRLLYGMTVLLIRRGSKVLPNPAPDTPLLVDDIVVVVGEQVPTEKAKDLFGQLKTSPNLS